MIENYVITVEIELGDSSLEDAIERVQRIPFGNNDCDFRIVASRIGTLPTGTGLAAPSHIRDNQNEGDYIARVISDDND